MRAKFLILNFWGKGDFVSLDRNLEAMNVAGEEFGKTVELKKIDL